MLQQETVKPPKYLVCVDGKPESRAALRLAAAKARVRRGAVSILHVIPPADFQSLQAVADHMRAEQYAAAKNLTQELAESIFAETGLRASVSLREGQIGDEIIAAAAEDADATMLVLGVAESSASRGKLTAWLASQLGGRLLTPLLLIPGNLTDQQLEGLI